MTELYYMEDDGTIAQAVKEDLESRGCLVTVFETIADMKRTLKIRQPDVVLTDWNIDKANP